jgi:hypothetical protein
VTAFFDGLFHNNFQPTMDSNVRFQVRLTSNETLKWMVAKIDHWDADDRFLAYEEFLYGFGLNQ